MNSNLLLLNRINRLCLFPEIIINMFHSTDECMYVGACNAVTAGFIMMILIIIMVIMPQLLRNIVCQIIILSSSYAIDKSAGSYMFIGITM